MFKRVFPTINAPEWHEIPAYIRKAQYQKHGTLRGKMVWLTDLANLFN